MSEAEDTYQHGRPSWDHGANANVNGDGGSDLGHPARAPGHYPRIPQTHHYVTSAESLDQQSHQSHQSAQSQNPSQSHSQAGHGAGGGPGYAYNGGAPPTPTKSTSPPRSSAESAQRPGGPRWRDSVQAGPTSDLGHGHGPGTGAALPRVSVEESVESSGGGGGDLDSAASAAEMATLVEPSFDENILRALCETDVSGLIPWLRRQRPLLLGGCLGLTDVVAVRRSASYGQNQAEYGIM